MNMNFQRLGYHHLLEIKKHMNTFTIDLCQPFRFVSLFLGSF